MAILVKTKKEIDRDCRNGLRRAIKTLKALLDDGNKQLENVSVSIDSDLMRALGESVVQLEQTGRGRVTVEAAFCDRPKG